MRTVQENIVQESCSVRLAALAGAVLAAAVLAVPGQARSLEMTPRKVELGSELTVASAQKVTEKLFKLDGQGTEPILLIISTRSGHAPAAMVVVDAIQALRSKVYAVVHSEAFGPGAIVAVFCERRYVFPYGAFLFSKLEYDSEKTMKEKPPLPVEAANAYLARINAAVAARIKVKEADLVQRSEKGWYLDAAEAKKLGIATEVVDSVQWLDLIEESVEIKKTSTAKRKRAVP